MSRRRFRKFSQNPQGEGDGEVREDKRLPYGLIWLVLTVILLVAVLMFDRRSIRNGETHISTGRDLAEQGLYVEALGEFEEALTNRRLGRKARAQAALSMADIYYNHFEDYPAAHRFYVQAKQESPSVLDSAIQERARDAAVRAQGAGMLQARYGFGADSDTTRTIVQRVELLSPPIADRQGPVIAEYNGGEIRAGQLLRELQGRPEFHRADFRSDPERLKAFLEGMLRTDMAYEAAVSAGVHKDPDLSARLYDYQKQLVTQRYLTDRRDIALRVENADVEKYYRENPELFKQRGAIDLSLIMADSEASATEYLQMIRDGVPFADVATSFSLHEQTASKGGVVGTIRDDATSVTAVGQAPDVIRGLFRMPVFSVSEVVRANGSYFVFRIDQVYPERHFTLAESRRRIENVLRGRAVDDVRHKLDSELDELFEPELNENALASFWDYVAESDRRNAQSVAADQQTTTSLVNGPSTGSVTLDESAVSTGTESAQP